MKLDTTRNHTVRIPGDDTLPTEIIIVASSPEQKLDCEYGVRAGRQWARHCASPRELQRLTKWKAKTEADPFHSFDRFCRHDEHPAGSIADVICGEDGDSKRFWDDRGWLIGRYPSRSFIRGFVEGALAAAGSAEPLKPGSGGPLEPIDDAGSEAAIANYKEVVNDPYLRAELSAWEQFASVVWDRITSRDAEDDPGRPIYVEGCADFAEDMLDDWKREIIYLAMKATGVHPVPVLEDPWEGYLAEMAAAPSSYDIIAKVPSLIAELEAWTKFAAGALAQSTQDVFVKPMSLFHTVVGSAMRMAECRRSLIGKIAKERTQTSSR